MSEKRYYVYRWYNTETNETFYIGKGTKGRKDVIQGRSKAFMEYYNSHKCANQKIKDNLTENEAYILEKEMIKKYRTDSNHLVNLDEGGRKLGVFVGEKNPMWKISPQKRMSPEVYKKWLEKHKDICGERNANYGKHTLKGTKQSLEHIKKRSGEKNGRAVKLFVTDLNGSVIGYFGCIKDFSTYLVSQGLDVGEPDNIRRRIFWNMNKNGNYKGFIIKKID